MTSHPTITITQPNGKAFTFDIGEYQFENHEGEGGVIRWTAPAPDAEPEEPSAQT